jgi:hypothetical protein
MNESPSTNAQFVHKLDCSDQKSLRFSNFRDNFARSRRCSPSSKPVSVRYRPAGARKETTSGQPFAAVARPLQGFMMHRSDGSI